MPRLGLRKPQTRQRFLAQLFAREPFWKRFDPGEPKLAGIVRNGCPGCPGIKFNRINAGLASGQSSGYS
jgi:hypothetical protein